ncbi:MAG: SCO family protein [Sulfitobacter sp.]|nr:SCO family protein [Sulfitobacter sp.]
MNQITSGYSRLRIVLWAGAIVAAVLVLTFATFRTGDDPSHRVTYTGEADIRANFSLINHEGRSVTEVDYAGRWLLVFFGFTHCADICPTTLAYMGTVLDVLGFKAEHVAPLFVTVDPQRDTAELLKEYVAAFHPRLIGLTGSEAQVSDAAESFKVYYERFEEEGSPDGYLMAHAGHIYLMRPDGKFEAVFLESGQPPEALAEEITMRIAKEMRNK